MLRQQRMHLLHRLQHRPYRQRLPEPQRQVGANLFPDPRADAGVNAPVREDFHRVVGQVDIEQHARVVLGVPHLQRAEQRPGAFARGGAAPGQFPRHAGLDHHADFPAMVLFAGMHRHLQLVLGLGGERPARRR
ncbi:hypothetical protein D3C86_1575630 [compost metagenome]